MSFSLDISDGLGVLSILSEDVRKKSHIIRKTQSSQGKASGFDNKRTPDGFGYLPSSTRFDPTHSLHLLLVPALVVERGLPRLRIIGEKPGFQTWGETEAGGISDQFSDVASTFGLLMNGQRTLKTRNMSIGIVNSNSYEDFHFLSKGVYCGIVEDKGAEGSISSAIVEGASIASNFAMQLLALHLPPEKCVVPVIANTGLCMVFGATIILPPSFPTYIPVSKRLDLSDPQERIIASAFLMKAKEHVENIGVYLQKINADVPLSKVTLLPVKEMLLAESPYHFIKRITVDVFNRGLGIFVNNSDQLNIGPGIEHMFEALNMLYASIQARHIPEYPLSIRTPDELSEHCYELVFRNLVTEGYCIGAPNRITDAVSFEKYKSVYREAVKAVNDAGVVHGDLYLSNVMWRQNNSTIDIKIIDWDTAHCLDEGRFHPHVHTRLADYLGEKNLKFSREHDELYVSVLDLDLSAETEQLWHDIASGIKETIDEGFRSLLGLILLMR